MYKEIELRVCPKEGAEKKILVRYAARRLGVSADRVVHLDIVRKAVDARQRQVMLILLLGVHIDRIEQKEKVFIPAYRNVADAREVVVVGAGPAGLFAALRLIERGFRPIVLERGKCVDGRKKDLASLYRTGQADPDSNFGFGEGGAGTFSDGKLYTRSKKRGDVGRILEILVYHGADPGILVDAHPHIGTDKLPRVIVNIRKTIEACGGEVRFNSRVTDFVVEGSRIRAVCTGEKEIRTERVILATGHSARDIYRLLYRRSVLLEPKDFAVGLRLEHPQYEIDCMQYHTREGRGNWLPAAEYSFAVNIGGRGVYTFCMCPGGVVVPAATGPEQQVVNGMSASGRNTPWANSAVVTSVGEAELEKMGYRGMFGGMEFQEQLEKMAWEKGGKNLYAPAQRLTDFLEGKASSGIPRVSYKPGVVSSPIHEWFPSVLRERLQAGITGFGKKAGSFISVNAVLLGVETRTSSPLKIPRNPDTMMHVSIEGLYPCGEGAGYAGGIVSAAMDGEKCAGQIS